jgi:hypothetical protein
MNISINIKEEEESKIIDHSYDDKMRILMINDAIDFRSNRVFKGLKNKKLDISNFSYSEDMFPDVKIDARLIEPDITYLDNNVQDTITSRNNENDSKSVSDKSNSRDKKVIEEMKTDSDDYDLVMRFLNGDPSDDEDQILETCRQFINNN